MKRKSRNGMKCPTGVFFIVIIACEVIFTCCMNNERKDSKGEEDRLYAETLALIRQYSDSLEVSKDTAAIKNLMIHFQDRLDRLNNKVAPETDMRMSEGQNDTLAQMLIALLRLRDERLFGRTDTITADTFASDSLHNIDSVAAKNKIIDS